ncbi:DUF4421 domain-containing protein [Flavobacterium agricola]|uniref:DUF4421 domain-containing protein n=1 Tax=Flavobacterium agricola TaxID=2870839 RepID=A0ABY6LXN1_9FLAO|nr:DUF4421 domain-containing protein [Flavobacterium agricola]UYW00931.1 DUF4421 domain-containing protein [Flavobacterium agricola]
MDKLIWTFVFFICIGNQIVTAQNDSINEYKISYGEKIIASISLQSDTESFVLSSKTDGQTNAISFYPNIKQKINFGVTYKLIDISFGYTPWFMRSNSDKYKTSNFNFGTRFNHKKWYQSVSFVKQKGFFSDFSGAESDYLPSFRSIRVGGTTSFVLNDNFSFLALFNQKEWQIKSAGSFVPNFSFYYTSFENKDDKSDFNLELFSFAITPSYYYTWVINRKVFLSGGLGVGAGLDVHNKKTSALGQITFNSKLGYNTTAFYSYLEINNTNFLFNENRTQVDQTALKGLITVGFRFDPPKIVKNTYNEELRKVNKELNKEVKKIEHE